MSKRPDGRSGIGRVPAQQRLSHLLRKTSAGFVESLEARWVLSPLTWMAGPPLPLARDHGVAVSDGYGGAYLISGATTVYHQGASALGSWASSFPLQNIGSAMGAARSSAGIVAFGGKVGNAATDESIYFDASLGDNQDTSTMNFTRALLGSGSYNGRAYAIGGQDGSSIRSSVEYFTPASDSWTLAAPMPSALYGFATVDDGAGHFFTFGGATANNANSVTSVVYEYDAAVNTWTTLASLPVPVREAAAALALDANGHAFIYVVGGATVPPGQTTAVVTDAVQVYDVTAGTWSTATSLPVAIKGAAARVDANGRLEIIGGVNASNQPQATVFVSQQLNQPDIGPAFTSTAPSNGSADKLYSYQLTATGNPLPTFSLISAPDGMSVDAGGLITWQPTPAQVGTQNVTVRATNIVGSVDQSFSINVILETVAPTAPTNVHVTGVSVNSISLAWDPGTDNTAIASYNVYRKYKTGFHGLHTSYVLVGNTTGTSFTVGGLASYTTRTYVVRSVDTSGNVSGYSNSASGTTYSLPTLTGPTAPSVAALHTLSFSLSSLANPKATFSLVTGPAGMTVDGTTGLVKWIPAVADIGNVPATFRATNLVGSTDLNVSVSVTPDVPVLSYRINPPSGPAWAVAGTPMTIQLSDFSLTPSTYSIVSGPAGMTVDPVTGLANWTPAYADAGTTVVTFNATNSAGSTDQSLSFTTCFTGAPTAIAASNVTATSATIAWTPPSDTSHISSYVVRVSYRTRAGRAYTTKSYTFNAPAGATSLNISGLTSYKTYTPYVYAVDALGHVGETGRGAAFVANTPPAPPPQVALQQLPNRSVARVRTSLTTPRSADSPPHGLTGLHFNVSFNDPSGTWAAYYDGITSAIQAAGAEWGRLFDSAASLEVSVGFDDTLATTAARSAAIAYIETDASGYDVYEQGAAAEINTGVDPNGVAADIELNIGVAPGANYLADSLWFDPNPASRAAVIPVGKIDAVSVMIHELGHAIGFNGWSDPTSGVLPGNCMSTFDQYVAATADGFAFNGGWANELAGTDPELAAGNIYHWFGAGPTEVLDSAGLAPQQRYDISTLDVAVMKDIGMSMDSVGPSATAAQFQFETGQSITIQFDESVRASLDAGDVTVLRLATTGAPTIAAADMSIAYDRATNLATITFPGLGPAGLADGRYVLTIAASGVTDPAGNPMLNDVMMVFNVLGGDANRDAVVDISDLAILATNWQQSGKTFSQGDFNYDGTVDISDLAILATNWQQSLPAPAAVRGTSATLRPAPHRLVNELLE